MKRLHVHVAVTDLARSVGFYRTLFGSEPTVLKDDYAKWMLEDPHVNFTLSTVAGSEGVDHLGIQVDDGDSLAEVDGRLAAAGAERFRQDAANCCYAEADKSWVTDPAGVAWEVFHTLDGIPVYGADRAKNAREAAAPTAPTEAANAVEEACCASVCCA